MPACPPHFVLGTRASELVPSSLYQSLGEGVS